MTEKWDRIMFVLADDMKIPSAVSSAFSEIDRRLRVLENKADEVIVVAPALQAGENQNGDEVTEEGIKAALDQSEKEEP